MGRSFWSTSTSPTCIGLATAVTFLGPWRTSRCCTSELLAGLCHFTLLRERDTGAVSSFAAIPQQLWSVRVWRQVHASIFCWGMRCLLGGHVGLTSSDLTTVSLNISRFIPKLGSAKKGSYPAGISHWVRVSGSRRCVSRGGPQWPVAVAVSGSRRRCVSRGGPQWPCGCGLRLPAAVRFPGWPPGGPPRLRPPPPPPKQKIEREREREQAREKERKRE